MLITVQIDQAALDAAIFAAENMPMSADRMMAPRRAYACELIQAYLAAANKLGPTEIAPSADTAPDGWSRFPAPPNTKIDALYYWPCDGTWLKGWKFRVTDENGMTDQDDGEPSQDRFWRMPLKQPQGTPKDWGFDFPLPVVEGK
jgi:hypothetical protein